MALITPKTATLPGQLHAPVAVSASDTVAPIDRGVLEVFNGGGVSCTVTVVTPGNDKYGQARPDIAHTVLAGAYWTFKINDPDLADPVTGVITVTFSVTASVTARVVAV